MTFFSPTPFVPTNIGNCVLWLEARRGYTNSNQLITYLVDLSGTGNNASQASATAPSIVAGAKPSLLYDGTDDRLQVANSTTLATGTGSFTIAATYTTPAAWWAGQQNRVLVDKSGGGAYPSSTDALGWGIGIAGTTGKIVCVRSGLNTVITANVTLLFNNEYRIIYMYNSITGHIRIYVNGVLDTDIASAMGNNTNTNPLGVGFLANGTTRFLQGNIRNITVYARHLSDGEVFALDNYMGS